MNRGWHLVQIAAAITVAVLLLSALTARPGGVAMAATDKRPLYRRLLPMLFTDTKRVKEKAREASELVTHPYELLERIERALIDRGYLEAAEEGAATEFPSVGALLYESESTETNVLARNTNTSFIVKVDVPGVEWRELQAHYIPPHTVLLEGEHTCPQPFAAETNKKVTGDEDQPLITTTKAAPGGLKSDYMVAESFCVPRVVKETFALRQPNLDFARCVVRHDSTGVVTIVVPKFHSDEANADTRHPRVTLHIQEQSGA